MLNSKLGRLFLAAAVVTAVGTAACSDDKTVTPTPVSKIVTFRATLSGASEVPANATTGTGLFTATLDTSTNVFSYDLTFSGLTSNVNNGHIHGPAAVGVNSGTTINFNTLAGATFSFGQTSGAGRGTITLSPSTQVTATINGDSLRKLLFAGLTYINIHTVNNGGGEVRGQVTKQ